MRSLPLVISVVVHGGALGVALAAGAFAWQVERRAARVEVVSLEARAPAPERQARPQQLPELPVEAEESEPEVPLRPEPELPVPEIVHPERRVEPPPLRPEPARPSRVRVVPAPVEPETVAPVAPVEPAPPPRPEPERQVHVAASPRADNVPPPYPARELRLGLEGEVMVGARIDRDGAVVAVRLLAPSAHAGFNRAALTAVRGWRFDPGTVAGAPVEEEVPVQIVFRLRGAGGPEAAAQPTPSPASSASSRS